MQQNTCCVIMSNNKMIVNKIDFYNFIGGLNVKLTVKTNKKPYDVDYKLNGFLVGQCLSEYDPKNRSKEINTYKIFK